MTKKFLSLLLILCLTLGHIPLTVNAAEITLGSNDDLAAKVAAAVDGSVIDLGGRQYEIADTNSNDSPWDIKKSVTIKNGRISLRAGGIVLGANVTFQDIQLDFPLQPVLCPS